MPFKNTRWDNTDSPSLARCGLVNRPPWLQYEHPFNQRRCRWYRQIQFHDCMKSREACIMSKRGQWVSLMMYNSHSFVAEIAQYKLIRSWSCLKARPKPVVKTKTKTKTGRFGLETSRDQDHGQQHWAYSHAGLRYDMMFNKNLAIANRSRVSCINTNNNTMTLKSGLEVTQGH